MSYTTLLNWGPKKTPQAVRTLLILIGTVSILSALTNGLFTYFIGTTGPQALLSLSRYGIENFFLWEPVTYLFIQEAGFQGITFSFLFSLSLHLYFLWVLGTSIHNRVGTKHFLSLFFLSGIVSGLAALFTMYFTGNYSFLAGSTSAILALLVVWTMIHLHSEFWLFFIVPIQAKWLLVGVLGIFLLISLSQLDLVSFVRYLSGALFGYFYGLFVFGLDSPFPFMDKIHSLFQSKDKRSKKHTSKIIDISGEPVVNDDHFVDEMLTKISKSGESSLTTAEKKRLNRISKSRLKNDEE